MSGIRHTLLACLTICLSGMHVFAEPLPEPYEVWVGNDGARVFSGPGDDYYATQQLPAGSQCQVYEELRDGWLAIRPPAGSHSLVLRSALEMNAQGTVGKVKRDATPCRVGSVVSENRNTVHIRLDVGELVQVMDDGTTSGSQWATIAPPAGEFRYVRSQDVLHSPPTPRSIPTTPSDRHDTWQASQVAPPLAANVGPAGVGSASDSEVVRVSNDEEAAPLYVPEVSFDAPPLDTTPLATSPLATSPLDAAPLNPSALGAPAPVAAAPTTAAPPAAAPPTSAPASPPANSFSRALDRLEIQLSRRVAGPVNLWVFEDLEREAAVLMSQASSAGEQQAVSNLASRMTRFAAIGQRSRTTSPAGTTAVASTTGSNATKPETPVTPDPALAKFDAVGVLRPVVSSQGNAPPYALVDDNGSVVTFVTPSPSLNLQHLLGQRVGVSGTRGYLPEYRNRNIQTANVAPVEGTVRR